MRERGLLQVLEEAHQTLAIRHELPTVEFGLYRLLVALVLDAFKPQNTDDWEELWSQGRFDADVLAQYFHEHQAYFDLFSAQHPFLQSAEVEGEDKPLAGLLPSQPSGTNAAHFQHGKEDAFAVSPAVAAQLLTTIAPFMTAGGAGLAPSINGAPPWYVLLQGRNLFETLLLNVPVRHDYPDRIQGDEVPTWRAGQAIHKEERAQSSLLQSLTWRPRRILLRPQLAPDNNGVCTLSGRKTPVLVSRMKFAPGWSTRIEGIWRDASSAYRRTKDAVLIVRPRQGRALWRDVGALLLAHDGHDQERPALISQYNELSRPNSAFSKKDVPLRLTGYGMRTDLKMKVFEWHREELSLPALLLDKPSWHGYIKTAMDRADEVAYSFQLAIKKTYPRQGAGNAKAFDALIERTKATFWERLRPCFLAPGKYLHRLAECDPSDIAALHTETLKWHADVQHVAREVLDAAINDLDTDGEAMKRLVEARKYFAGRLWHLLNPEDAQARKSKKKGAA